MFNEVLMVIILGVLNVKFLICIIKSLLKKAQPFPILLPGHL